MNTLPQHGHTTPSQYQDTYLGHEWESTPNLQLCIMQRQEKFQNYFHDIKCCGAQLMNSERLQ